MVVGNSCNSTPHHTMNMRPMDIGLNNPLNVLAYKLVNVTEVGSIEGDTLADIQDSKMGNLKVNFIKIQLVILTNRSANPAGE